ncbi:diguanylate cyclase [Alginatibacterium sediminis]|uniref:Diguanylate cyclase n=1 Tax=Alginatibacterium sediminis TaxID=2164068 RepID=A0A420EGC5_9ALTE|nr:diguanylate cyclase [Alginatibacterium sediminis]RKF19759.1 diguanylate cyclase [Alginatibacterium sediminis]
MKFISLRRRIVFPLFASILGLFIVFQLVSDYNYRKEAEHSLISHIEVLSKGVAINLSAAVLFEDQDAALEVMDTFSADPQVLYAVLSLNNQPHFSQYSASSNSVYEFPPLVEQNLARQRSFIYQRELFSQVPVMLGADKLGTLTVVVNAQSLFDWSNALRQAIFYLVLCALTGLFLYYRINSHVIAPVEKLNSAVRGLSGTKQQWQAVDTHANDELGNLVQGFNNMGEELTKQGIEIEQTLERLEQEKAYANEVIESAQYALIVADSFGTIKLSNIKALELFGQSRPQLEGNSISNYLQFEAEKLQDALKQSSFLIGARTQFERSSGEKRQLRVTSSELPHIGWSLFTIEDVTEQEKHLQRQQLMARVFENSQDGILVLNPKFQITMTNPAFVQLLGYSEIELVGKTLDDITPWHQLRNLLHTANDSLKTFNMWQGEVWEEHKSGRSIPLSVKANPLVSNNKELGNDIVLIVSDISNVKEVERLEYLAHHDSLTGLANRAQLYGSLESIIAKGQLGSFAIIYMDLDGFKAINDNHGHVAGDAVLKTIAVRMQQLVRNQDLVARLAGDEFVIVLRHTDNSGADHLAKRVLETVAQPIIFEGLELKVGVSIGVHMTQRNIPETSEQVLRSADKAMYSAKAKGKGTVVSFFQSVR